MQDTDNATPVTVIPITDLQRQALERLQTATPTDAADRTIDIFTCLHLLGTIVPAGATELRVQAVTGKAAHWLKASSAKDVRVVRGRLTQNAAMVASPADVEYIIEMSSSFISIGFTGYGECTAMAGYGRPVILELHGRDPQVRIFDSINKEEPRTVSLHEAAETNRLDADDEVHRCPYCSGVLLCDGPEVKSDYYCMHCELDLSEAELP